MIIYYNINISVDNPSTYQITIPINNEVIDTLYKGNILKYLKESIFQLNNKNRIQTAEIIREQANQSREYKELENNLLNSIIGYRLYILPSNTLLVPTQQRPMVEPLINQAITLETNDSIELITRITEQDNIDRIKSRRASYSTEIANIFTYNKKFSLLPFHILMGLSGLGIGILLVIVLKYGFNMNTENIPNSFISKIFTKKNSN